MISSNTLASHTETHQPTFFSFRNEQRHILCFAILATLLGAGTAIVYQTGGTAFAYPYLMLIPVLLASAWYRLVGGVVTAAMAGILMAAMPLDVDRGITQGVSNWAIRLALYIGIGAFSGSLFQSMFRINRSREKLLYVDAESGLLNVTALRKHLDKKMMTQREDQAITLVLIRAVDITEVLEVLGMDASGELMAAVGQRVIKLVPPSASLYRFSNSEIMVMLPAVERLNTEQIVQNLIDAGEENLTVQGMPMRAQMVFGSSTYRADSTAANLISEARMAMFSSIEKGNSHQAFTPSLRRRTLETIQLISRVREGLDKYEFELHYQPKIRLEDDTVCGCEGLIRWRDHSSGGFIPPGKFMPKVENTTLITPVTHFVLEEAFRFAGTRSGVVSINFSGRNILDQQLINRMGKLLEQTGLPPGQLEIELTESVLMRNLDAAKRSIQAIRSLGVGVSIDDFGTGFASFEYLRHLPVTGLKIDRVFVTDLETDEKSRRLISCMIEVGHALGLLVTAEGVETSGQRDILKCLGCDHAQGFLFSPAIPAERYGEWVGGRSGPNKPR
ncbi:MAG: GGDEF domain-containing phosphodiesterase [Marinobacter sp.]|uniref:putative bifunctional diguanylate cyclase/phosphodiesterase n=1 Tax=Marinobacter sp. TaxID=50741 RepID=UPI0034A02491